MTKRLRAVIALVGAALLVVIGAPAAQAVAHSKIEGTGSTWAALAVGSWVADVDSMGIPVGFTPTGSAQGRQNFAASVTDYGVSDIGYQMKDAKTGAGDVSSRPYAYLPIVAGGTAFPYNITVGGKRVTSLRLAGLTLAKIFMNQITNWNDPAITADNNGHPLPSKKIIPVVHSEGAGSTAMFTMYLASLFPDLWSRFNKNPSFTEYFPATTADVAMNQSDGVMNYITSPAGDGSIGYDEYSYALSRGFPAAQILNTAGYYTLPTQYNDAVALTLAQINLDPNSKDYLTQKLDQVYTNPAKQTYPLSSYSYAIIPTAADDSRMTTPKRQTMADFLFYSVCNGQRAIGNIGYSSLPLNLVKRSIEQIAKLGAADPGVKLDNQAPTSCSNPTFDKSNPEANLLAETAPVPPDCDKLGQGPCAPKAGSAPLAAAAPGAGNKSTKPTGGASKPAAGAAGAAGGNAAAAPAAAGGSAAAAAAAGADVPTDPETGLPVGGAVDTTSGSDAVAASTTLAAYRRPGNGLPYAVIAVLLLVGVLVAPPLIARRLSARKEG